MPTVEAISSTGAITRANSVSYSSATSITANFTLATDGTYIRVVTNDDTGSSRLSSALLTVSDLPTFSTGAGSIGTNAAGEVLYQLLHHQTQQHIVKQHQFNI